MELKVKNSLGSKLQSHTKYRLCASKLKNSLNFSNGPLFFDTVVFYFGCRRTSVSWCCAVIPSGNNSLVSSKRMCSSSSSLRKDIFKLFCCPLCVFSYNIHLTSHILSWPDDRPATGELLLIKRGLCDIARARYRAMVSFLSRPGESGNNMYFVRFPMI